MFSLFLTFLLGQPLPTLSIALLSLGLGSVSYGLSIFLFVLAKRNLGAARTGTLFGVAPFIGTFLALTMLREMPQLLFWLAAPIMLAGTWLMLTEHHDHHHLHESMEHTHAHVHDEHHDHEHPADVSALVNGTHTHLHNELEHNHTHTPDLYHRHEHARTD